MKPKHVYSNMPEDIERQFVNSVIGPILIGLINRAEPPNPVPESIADLAALFHDATEWKVSPRTLRRWLNTLGLQLYFRPHWTTPQQEITDDANTSTVAEPAPAEAFDNDDTPPTKEAVERARSGQGSLGMAMKDLREAQKQGTGEPASLETLTRELAHIKAMLAMPRPSTPSRPPQAGPQPINLDRNPFAPAR